MSVYRIIDNKINECETIYAELLGDFSAEVKSGSAFMIYSLTTIFRESEFEEIEAQRIWQTERRR